VTSDAAILLVNHVVGALLAVAVACALGCVATRRLAWSGQDERFLVASVVGLGLWGHGLLALGVIGWLRPGPLVAAILVACGFAARELIARRPPRSAAPERSAPRWVWAVFAAIALPVAGLFVLRSLFPPTGFDSTMYHLPYAKAFAASGQVPFLPDLRYPVFPQLQELLFTACLLLWDDLGAQLLQAVAALLTAGLLVVWGRTVGAPWAGVLAAAMWLGTPIVWWLAGRAYIDLGLGLFVTATAFALERWRASRSTVWLLLAAWMAGSAAAGKYTGLFVVVWLVAVAAWDGRPQAARSAFRAALVAGLTLAPWYLRIWYHTGTPVHPFLQTLFTGAEAPNSQGLLSAAAGFERGWVVWLQLPWKLSLPNHGLEWSWGYLAGLPCIAWLVWREPWARRPAALALAWSLVYALVVFPDPRLLLPIAPLCSLLAAVGLTRLAAPWLRPRALRAVVLVALIAAALFPGLRFGTRRGAEIWRFPTNAEQREAYLLRRIRGYAAVAELNRRYGSRYSLYSMFAEPANYYVQGRVQGDWFGPASYGTVFPLMNDPERLAARFRELGVDHVLLGNFGHVAAPEETSEAFRCRFETVLSEDKLRLFRLLDPPRCPTEG
jgi:hypothetical protein